MDKNICSSCKKYKKKWYCSYCGGSPKMFFFQNLNLSNVDGKTLSNGNILYSFNGNTDIPKDNND